MRRLLVPTLALGLLAPVSGCTWLANTFGGTPDAATQTAIVHGFLDACDVYKEALRDATTATNAGLLSDAQKAKIHSIRPGIEAICPPGGAMPTNATAALVSVVTGTAQIYSAIKGQ